MFAEMESASVSLARANVAPAKQAAQMRKLRRITLLYMKMRRPTELFRFAEWSRDQRERSAPEFSHSRTSSPLRDIHCRCEGTRTWDLHAAVPAARQRE